MHQQEQQLGSPTVPPLVALIGVRSRVQQLSGRLQSCLDGLKDLADEEGLDSMPEHAGVCMGSGSQPGKAMSRQASAQETMAVTSPGTGHAVAWVEIAAPAATLAAAPPVAVAPAAQAQLHGGSDDQAMQQRQFGERNSFNSVVNPLFRPVPDHGSGASSFTSDCGTAPMTAARGFQPLHASSNAATGSATHKVGPVVVRGKIGKTVKRGVTMQAVNLCVSLDCVNKWQTSASDLLPAC